MNKFFSWKAFAFILLFSGVILASWVLIFGDYLSNVIAVPDSQKAKELHPFMTGLVVPLLTLGSTLLVIENLRVNTLQNFSNNFFKLIDQHHKLTDNIITWVEAISSQEHPCKGRTFFDEMAERIANDYYSLSNPSHTKHLSIDIELINLASQKTGKELLVCIYDYYFHIHQSDLGHYFTNLYQIILFVENSSVSQAIKTEHIYMLRAQLSNYEILLLAYNGLHNYGRKFHPLIEKYQLLEYLNTEEKLASGRVKRIIDLSVLKEDYKHFQI
jgi:hypothetical protein